MPDAWRIRAGHPLRESGLLPFAVLGKCKAAIHFRYEYIILTYLVSCPF